MLCGAYIFPNILPALSTTTCKQDVQKLNCLLGKCFSDSQWPVSWFLKQVTEEIRIVALFWYSHKRKNAVNHWFYSVLYLFILILAESEGLFYDPSRLRRAGLSQTKQRCALFIFIFIYFAKKTLHAPENGNAPPRRDFVWLAERQGFEPWVQLPVQRFSRPSHSTALASLLISTVQKYLFMLE